jgi:energy-coupling factor transporter ATP-binding protein EcfA2
VGQELKLGQRRLTAEKAEAVLEQVGLGHLSLQQAPERLSGGQQRRLALAVQLVRDARVLLLDEPTAGLDWTVREEVLQLLADLARERALLVVTILYERTVTAPDVLTQRNAAKHIRNKHIAKGVAIADRILQNRKL